MMTRRPSKQTLGRKMPKQYLEWISTLNPREFPFLWKHLYCISHINITTVYHTTAEGYYEQHYNNRTIWARQHQKGKPFWILIKRWSGSSGMSWTICKSFAPCCRQITMTASHFYRPNAFPDAQPTASRHCKTSSDTWKDLGIGQ